VPAHSGTTLASAVQRWIDGETARFEDAVDWPGNAPCSGADEAAVPPGRSQPPVPWTALTTHPTYNDSTPLTHVPTIMAHDAGSGYLGRGIVNAWTKTQPHGLDGQLDCGARAFDARPHYSTGGGLQWHHGDIVVPYLFNDSLTDVIEWLAAYPTELVTLHLWDCTGDGCDDELASILAALELHVITDCSELKGLTLGEARALGALPRGGSLLALTTEGGCSEGNYDPSVACSGYSSDDGDSKKAAPAAQVAGGATPRVAAEGSLEAGGNGHGALPHKYGCWETDSTKSLPLDRMFGYLDRTSQIGFRDEHFMQMQALWQESTESVVIGTLRNSSLLTDEANSKLNQQLAAAVRQGRWATVSLLEVNNVCDGGTDLLAALRGR